MIPRLALVALVVLLVLGCRERTPTFTLNPVSGPSTTEVTFTLTGLEPGAPVTITVDTPTPTTSTTRADANGVATAVERLFGEPGQVLTATAVAGFSGREVTLTATFTVTE